MTFRFIARFDAHNPENLDLKIEKTLWVSKGFMFKTRCVDIGYVTNNYFILEIDLQSPSKYEEVCESIRKSIGYQLGDDSTYIRITAIEHINDDILKEPC